MLSAEATLLALCLLTINTVRWYVEIDDDVDDSSSGLFQQSHFGCSGKLKSEHLSDLGR